MFNRRISIFTGHFGSGKTEVAVNCAFQLASLDRKTAIVDFDIVNPYFRTTDVKCELERNNIWAVTPMYANTNVDVPALPPEISSLFEKKEYSVVFDVGGDDLGARVLSRYREEIIEDDYEMYFVINTKRPMTDTLLKIEEMIYCIQESSRLKVTKLVNNTNLLQYTKAEDILEGHKLVEAVSQKLNIPIGFVSCPENINLSKYEDIIGSEILYLKQHIKLPWDR